MRKLSSTIGKFIIGILLTHNFSNINAQLTTGQQQAITEPTLYDIQNYVQQECEHKDLDDDGEWNQYKRWESFWEPRTAPSGEFPDPEILFREYTKLKDKQGFSKGQATDAANWNFIGPSVVPTNGGGAGRINCMAFDPGNSNIIWVGAACGGLWKSTDGGQTWNVSGTDLLPSLSISDIAIDPVNKQNMYLLTGDKYGICPGYFTKGHYSAGVLKSTDGGLTWSQTGLNYTLSNKILPQRLIIHPSNPQILFAACMNGLYKTTDGGATWSLNKSGKYYDLEMNPGNPNILYAADSNKIFISTDGGTNWNVAMNAYGRSSIAVTAGFPNVVYIWASGSLYYSSDAGVNFSFRQDPKNACNAMGHYDMVLEVASGDENVLLAGGVDVAISTDGGTTWTTKTTPGALHADQKAFAFIPGSSTTAFACNDGGIFKTTDQGSTFSDLSKGLNIKQYYRMSSSMQNPAVMVAGAQDNGTDKITAPGTASMIVWFDGEACKVDQTNDNIIFASTQGGAFKRSTNGGTSFSNISASGCYWTSPIAMDPNNHNVVYIGSGYLRKSVNNGVTWTTLVDPVFDGTCIYSMEICKANSSYMYAATFKHIYKTADGGTTWSDITGTLPVANASLTGVTSSGTDPNKIWVCFSGFSQTDKIFYSADGGTTWTNVSAGIPNVPVNCIRYQNGSNDFVYAATDLGVFFKDTSASWAPFNTGMPNVIVNDLEMYYPTKKIRAATYGRGIWESDFHDSLAVTGIIPQSDELSVKIFPNPSSDGKFKVQSSKFKVGTAELYDVTGRFLKTLEVEGGMLNVNEQKGIYFIRFLNNNSSIAVPVVIQ